MDHTIGVTIGARAAAGDCQGTVSELRIWYSAAGHMREPPSIVRRVAVAAAVLILGYLAVCIAALVLQGSLLFFPTRTSKADELREAASAGLEPWRSAGGELIGWRRPRPDARARLVLFHGNAGTALDRSVYADGFEDTFDVYLFEYPGYGSRPGTPGAAAFVEGGAQAVAALLADDTRPVYLLGESIGSGIASAVAARHGRAIAGVVLVIPFARLSDVASRVVRWLPVRLLLRHELDNVAALAAYAGPVVVVIAEHDEVVSPEQGRLLFEAYRGPKSLVVLPGATHNVFPVGRGAAWQQRVTAFLGADGARIDSPPPDGRAKVQPP